MFQKYKVLFISILISLGIGGLSAFFTMNDMKTIYTMLNKPPLSPPGAVFGIVWAILYVLMGVSAYLIYESHSKQKQSALMVYGVQIILNFFWSIIFFRFQMRLLAFFWIILMIAAIALMIKKFYKINPLAAYLQIPYLLWTIFAAYLNLGIYLLNR